MKTGLMVRSTLVAIGLAVGIVPVAYAGHLGKPDTTHRPGPYDNTGNGPQQSGLEGGGG
jgi:hypothetical protein